MKEPKPIDFPLNEDIQLRPTKTFFIHHEGVSGFSKSTIIHDITAIMPADLDINSKGLANTIHSETKANLEKLPVALKLQRSAWYSSSMDVKDGNDTPVASLSTSLLSFSHWTLSFPADSPHSTHAIEMRPTGVGTRTDIFVKESVPYFWEMFNGPAGGRIDKLFKVEDGKRVEVARFVAKHMRDREGALFLDGAMVDEVVAAVTCVAVLNRLDSFRK
ncbi:hypothetical protein GGS26DRAFT_498825 [Hypomontagnella submonticulosa]|nr:hypothetical protein GGS26DRAFT_498825 [Hypomontagnella submonticulosa]